MTFSSDSMSLKTAAHRLARLSLLGLGIAGLAVAPVQAIVYTYEAAPAAAIPTIGGTSVYTSVGANLPITDNAYNGTQASMACKTIAVASEAGLDSIGGPVAVTVPIFAGRVGNLVVKLFTPTDTYVLMSRPGFTEAAADNGADAGDGDDSNLALANPITFAMAAATEAEVMGGTVGGGTNVCPGEACSYNPDNGSVALGEDLTASNTDSKFGNWTLCVGDANTGGASGSTGNGTLGNWTLDLGSIAGPSAPCDAGTGAVSTAFSVPDSFTVASIALGLNITHGDRGQVRATLIAPGGASLNFVSQTTAADGDANNDYDIYLSPLTDGGGTNPLNDGDTDPTAEPYYHRLVDVASGFYSGNASGIWTLRTCDLFSGASTGTLNRARLVLTSAATYTPVCSSRTTFDFCPGCLESPPAAATSTAFPGGGMTADNVTLTLTSTTLADATGSARNFSVVNTQTGGEFGYYVTEFNATAAQVEVVRSETNWAFNPPVTDLQWVQRDQDRSAWEDYVRVRGLNGSTEVRYDISTSGAPSYQLGGEMLETDSDSTPPDTFGNAFWNFSGTVSAIRSEYWAGDDFADPVQQFIGYGAMLFCAYDFGDAPLTYGSAGQVLGDRTLYMGPIPPDGEGVTPAAPNSAATTDDITAASGGIDDEDGVPSFPNSTIVAGGTYTVTGIVVNNTTGLAANLCGWVDFDTNGQGGATGDGAFGADEGACIVVPASGSAGTCTAAGTTFTCSMTWTVPADYVRNSSSTTYARFRLSSGALTASNFSDSGAPSTNPGEVEDYQISAATLPVTLAWVESVPSGGGLAVRFATATETANAGFRIWGTNGQGKRALLASLRSQGADSFAPQHYETTVRDSRLAGLVAIEIEDMSLFGENRTHGPFAVGSTFGRVPEANSIDWAAIRSETGAVSHIDRMHSAEATGVGGGGLASMLGSSAPALAKGLLLVRDEGIHRVTFEELLSAGIDLSGVPASRIAVVDDGVGVPRHVETVGGSFGLGSYIEFVARPRLTLTSPVDAYVLTTNAREAIAVSSVDPGHGGSGVTASLDLYHTDRIYSPASPNGDPWYDERILAWGEAATLSRGFDLPNLASGTVSLRVKVWGYGDQGGAAPDHHVIVRVNGTEVAQHFFDGLTSWEPDIDVSAQVSATGNVLEVLVPADTGYAYDYIAFEGFELSYTRATVARSERFQGTVPPMRAFSIGGFADGDSVAVWKATGKTMTRELRQPVRGAVVAAGGPGNVYAASQNALYSPGISPGVPAAQLKSTAEYLIVTHPSLAGATADLVALEESRGFATEVVTTDKIFAAYSDHASSAEALKSFLSASLARGNLRYVLLVGADTSDPYDHLGLGSISFVPTDYRNFTPVVTFSPTDESLVDRWNDGLGDVPIGRLPARTPAELEAVVAKLYEWEAAIGAGRPSALLVAGLSDSERAIASVNEAYAASLSGWNTVLAQVDDSNTATVRQQALDAISAGAHLVSYVGHSSMGQWDFTPILKWQDVETLTNAGLPNLFTAWGCWNSYYVEPTIESLSARLLREPDAGAAGAIGATTLTSESSHRLLGNLFFARVNAGARTVGQAFHGAKQDLQQQGGAADAILGMTLLGDPAMSLPQP